MFYVLNFADHRFVSCTTANEVEMEVRRLLDDPFINERQIEIINGFDTSVRYDLNKFREYSLETGMIDKLRGYQSADVPHEKYPHDFGNGYKIQTFYSVPLSSDLVNDVGDISDERTDIEEQYPDNEVVIGYAVVCEIDGYDFFPNCCNTFCKTVEEAIEDYEKYVLRREDFITFRVENNMAKLVCIWHESDSVFSVNSGWLQDHFGVEGHQRVLDFLKENEALYKEDILKLALNDQEKSLLFAGPFLEEEENSWGNEKQESLKMKELRLKIGSLNERLKAAEEFLPDDVPEIDWLIFVAESQLEAAERGISLSDERVNDLGKLANTFVNDIKKQFELRENENAYGESKAFVALDNGRTWEIIRNQDGLEEECYEYIIHMHVNEEEFEHGMFADNCGIMETLTVGTNLEIDDLYRAVYALLLFNETEPVVDYDVKCVEDTKKHIKKYDLSNLIYDAEQEKDVSAKNRKDVFRRNEISFDH